MRSIKYEGVDFNADYFSAFSESEFVEEVMQLPHIFSELSEATKKKALKKVYALIKDQAKTEGA